jgi:predicted nucleotidyltransferase
MYKSRNLDKIAQKLADYLESERGIITAYVFGSFGTEAQTPLSDIDIALSFDGDIPVMEELKTAEISSLLEFEKIDLINLNKAPVHLQHEVLYTGTKIFDRTPERTQDFIEYVLEIYHDYQGILKKYQDDFREGLMEEYLNGK